MIFPKVLDFGSSAVAVLTPINVSGKCSAEAVVAHFEGEAFVELMIALGVENDNDVGVSLFSPTRSLLRNYPDEIESAEVPECLEGVIVEELAVADEVLEMMEGLADSESSSNAEMARAMWTLTRADVSVRRVRAAQDKLTDR